MNGAPRSEVSHGSVQGPAEVTGVTPVGSEPPRTVGTIATPASVPPSLTTIACALATTDSEAMTVQDRARTSRRTASE